VNKSSSTKPLFPRWFVQKYQHELYVTSISLQNSSGNLTLVALGTDQDPDLPEHVFSDLTLLAKEAQQTVEGIFALEPTGSKCGGEAGKFTVQPDGTVLQDTQQTGETIYLRKNYFSGANTLQPLK